MEANELKMKIQENYFYKLDNLKEVKVIWKKYDKANILEIGIDYPTAIVDLDRLSGIKITEEWLLKFGFIKNLWKEKNITYYLFNGIIVILKNDYYENGAIFYKNTLLFEEKLNLHQLQNLYFCLTNKELELCDI
jgi:hypothetical protein